MSVTYVPSRYLCVFQVSVMNVSTRAKRMCVFLIEYYEHNSMSVHYNTYNVFYMLVLHISIL
jgi:hypothetical protein